MRRFLISSALVIVVGSLLSSAQIAAGQSADPSQLPSAPPTASRSEAGGVGHDAAELFRRFPSDQVAIFTAPFRLTTEKHSWRYVIPFVAAAALIPLDRHITAQLPGGHGGPSQTISDVGVFGTGGVVGALYIYGLLRHDDHARETGLLGTESLLNTLLPRLALSYAFGRYRPFQGPGEDLGEGEFFGHHAWSTSFPSGHAAYEWAMATAIAEEYPSKKSKLFWYGLGTAVAVTRVTARQHFASDVVAGSALGYLIAHHIFRVHHEE